jgi:hypothetical protein
MGQGDHAVSYSWIRKFVEQFHGEQCPMDLSAYLTGQSAAATMTVVADSCFHTHVPTLFFMLYKQLKYVGEKNI